MLLNSSTMDWISKGLERQTDSLGKLTFLVNALEQFDFDSFEWQDLLGRVNDIISASDMDACIERLESASSPQSKFVLCVLLERSGRFGAAAEALEGFSFHESADLEVLRLQMLARNKAQRGEPATAVVPLKRAIWLSDSYRSVAASARILKMLGNAGPQSCKRSVRVAVIGNATFELLVPQLKTMAFSYGLHFELFTGAYDQHAQEVLDPSSQLRSFCPEIVIIAGNTHGLAIPEESTNEDMLVAAKIKEFTRLWSSCVSTFHCSVIQHNFVVPEVSSFGRLSNSLRGGRARVIRRLNLELEDAAASVPGVSILDVEQIASVLGKRTWEDERMWIQAKQYPSAAGSVSLVKHQVALVRSMLGLGSKCIVLDLDNTLWGGIVGEDGVNGIHLGGSPKGEAYASFQKFLLGLHQRGVILAICSKNNETDALEVFDMHPEMILKREHISVFAANWQPKSESLRQIAARLNVGLDSLVFVDDNPVERELVRKELPEIEVLDMPDDPSQFAQTVHRSLLFESTGLTSEDRQRTEAYRANSERKALESSTSTVEEFLLSLHMQAKLRRFDTLNEPRIVQLINKTNQFNLTTQRMSDAQVRAYALKADHYTQFLQLMDRFGDNGIVGILMAAPDADYLRIEQWLMSCRVLGRRVEEVMLCSVWKYARSCGYKKLLGSYRPTAKNSQVANLYDRLGFTLLNVETNGTRCYELELSKDLQPSPFFAIDDQTREAAEAAYH
jgi:FkbH-like protein